MLVMRSGCSVSLRALAIVIKIFAESIEPAVTFFKDIIFFRQLIEYINSLKADALSGDQNAQLDCFGLSKYQRCNP